MPFQSWHKFKEAFAPEVVAEAVRTCPLQVKRCLDPFAGSGTTGIASQFLGVHPVMAEVNPYLADSIEAKLSTYSSLNQLRLSLATVIEASHDYINEDLLDRFSSVPPTLIEPGRKQRWVFHRCVANAIAGILKGLDSVCHPDDRRLLRVLLGGVLVEVSNVVVSGKGRRYRRHWETRTMTPDDVVRAFHSSVHNAIRDIERYTPRMTMSYDILRGDSRYTIADAPRCEISVFSPPYPNSFDYTDVYNLELWMLGYLDSPTANTKLRLATLSSHVQVSRTFAESPHGSQILREVLDNLHEKRGSLWDNHIPAMIGGYFSDLLEILTQLRNVIVDGGQSWIVIGDSSYAGIRIPTGKILSELVESRGWEVQSVEPLRSMPSSAQQGSHKVLLEQLLVLRTS